MTVSSTNSRNDYIIGEASAYPFTFRIFNDADLVVTAVNQDGVVTRLVLGSDYSVTGAGSRSGGAVELVNPDAYAGQSLAIRRVLSTAQDTAFRNQGAFFAESHEDAFDRAAMIDQQQAEELSRAFKIDPSEPGDGELTLPPTGMRSNKLLGFDALGRPVAVTPAAQSAAALQATLGQSAGASMVGFTQAGAGAVARTVQDKLRDVVSIKDFDTALAAAASGKTIYVPDGVWNLAATVATAPVLLDLLSRLDIGAQKFTLTLPDGIINLSAPVVPESGSMEKIEIKGAAHLNKTVIGIDSVTGSAKAYAITYVLAEVEGIAVGQYLYVPTFGLAGTGDYKAHEGVWQIIGVDSASRRVTCLNTYHGASFPVATLTSGALYVLRTVLKFAGCDGFRIAGGHLGLLQDVAIVGDWNLVAGTGTLGAHGVTVATPRVLPGDDSNAPQLGSGGITFGPYVGVSAFGEQGVVGEIGSSMSGNYVAACANRKRGIYVSQSDWRGKFAIGSGNGQDGIICDLNGSVDASSSSAHGNGLNGFWATNGGFINTAGGAAIGNLQYGAESRGGSSRLIADSCTLRLNQKGAVATDGAALDADNAKITGNTNDGIEALYNSTVDANGATVTGNGDKGVSADYGSVVNVQGGTVSGNAVGDFNADNGSIIRLPAGGVQSHISVPTTLHKVLNANSSGLQVTSSTIGDATFSLDGTGAGTFVARYIMKAAGQFMASTDNGQDLGRASNRWATIFAGTATISTSDLDSKQDIRELSAAERRVAVALKASMRAYRFKDAVEAKGDAARIHFGTIAQEVKEAFEAEGLVAESYGMLCHDEWGDEYETDPVTGEQKLTTAAGSRYGIRYDELFAFILAAL